MKFISFLFTLLLFVLTSESNYLFAKSRVEKQLVTLNAQIDEFVTNKQYSEGIAFCNKKIYENDASIVVRSLLVSKLRLILKSKTNLESVPVIYYQQLALQVEDNDSLNFFLTARSEEILGHYYYKKSDSPRAIRQLNLADSIYALANAYEYRVYNLNMLGTIYQLSGNFTDALITLTRADRMLNQHLITDSALHIDLHIDIGLIYFKLGRFAKATTYYKQLLFYKLSKLQKAQVLNNLAIISIQEAKFNEAIDYLKEAKRLYAEVGNSEDLARIYNNLGSALLELHYPSDTITHCFLKSIALKSESLDSAGMVSPLINLNMYLLQVSDYKNLISYSLELDPFKKYFTIQDNASFYYLKSNIKQHQGDLASALEYYKLFYLYNDSIVQKENDWQLSKAESEVELEKKQNRINLLQKEHAFAEDKTIQQRYVIISISALSTTLIFALLIVIRFYKKRQRLEHRIRTRDVKLASVSNLVKGQEEERLRIAKDLHDGVGNNLAMIRAEILKNNNNKDYLAQLITQTAEEVRNITHDLMPVAIRKFGLIEALNDLTEKWKHTNQVFIDVNYETEIKIDKNVSLTIYRIVQELINNSITHGQASYIIIMISQKKGALTLIYEDNGNCFDEDLCNQKTGIGRENINNRVSYLNGTLEISKKSSGLKYTFVFRDHINENTDS